LQRAHMASCLAMEAPRPARPPARCRCSAGQPHGASRCAHLHTRPSSPPSARRAALSLPLLPSTAGEEPRDKDVTTPSLTLSRPMVSPPAEVVTAKADGRPPSPPLVVPCQRSWELGAGLGPPVGVCWTGYFGLARHETGPWAWAWAVIAARGLPRHSTMGCRTELGTTRN
jgi:hypothetical protein